MKNTISATKIFIFLAMVSVLASTLSCTAAKQVLDFANKVGEQHKAKIDSIAKDTVFYTATVEKVDTEYTSVKKVDTLYNTITLSPETLVGGTMPDWLNLGPGVDAKLNGPEIRVRTVKGKTDTIYITKTITKTVTKYVDKECSNCGAGDPQPKNWLWVVLAIIGVIASRLGIKKADSIDTGIS